jgi:hypothetical protein
MAAAVGGPQGDGGPTTVALVTPFEPQPEPDGHEQATADVPLPTMAQLDQLSADLDDIDAVLARMDARPAAAADGPSPG